MQCNEYVIGFTNIVMNNVSDQKDLIINVAHKR